MWDAHFYLFLRMCASGVSQRVCACRQRGTTVQPRRVPPASSLHARCQSALAPSAALLQPLQDRPAAAHALRTQPCPPSTPHWRRSYSTRRRAVTCCGCAPARRAAQRLLPPRTVAHELLPLRSRDAHAVSRWVALRSRRHLLWCAADAPAAAEQREHGAGERAARGRHAHRAARGHRAQQRSCSGAAACTVRAARARVRGGRPGPCAGAQRSA